MPPTEAKLFRYICYLAMLAVTPAHAQTPSEAAQTHGTLVIVPAYGEVTHANDEVHATWQVEEQDQDKAAAASHVNLKMKQGIEIVKREDPSAALKTRGYYTYPVYADDQVHPDGKPRQPVGWRIGQSLEMTTTNLGDLPRTVAAVQQLLTLNSLRFDLAPATARKLDQQRIEAAYQNLSERIAAIAKAMGRKAADAELDTVTFEGSGNYAQSQFAAPVAMRFAAKSEAAPVEEPSFEPGETTLQLQVVGKFKFK